MKLNHFTVEQLEEIRIYLASHNEGFEIKRYKVKDGVVFDGEKVWWHCVDGPQEVNISDHRENVKKYPDVYSVERPAVTVKYL